MGDAGDVTDSKNRFGWWSDNDFHTRGKHFIYRALDGSEIKVTGATSTGHGLGYRWGDRQQLGAISTELLHVVETLIDFGQGDTIRFTLPDPDNQMRWSMAHWRSDPGDPTSKPELQYTWSYVRLEGAAVDIINTLYQNIGGSAVEHKVIQTRRIIEELAKFDAPGSERRNPRRPRRGVDP